MTTQPNLIDVPEHLSPAEIARRKDDSDFRTFTEAKGIRTHKCNGGDPDWSAWYGVDSPLDFCADHKTPDGKWVGFPQQADCFGYGDTEKEAVDDLVTTWTHLGHWRAIAATYESGAPFC
jgi:hypothetical protein